MRIAIKVLAVVVAFCSGAGGVSALANSTGARVVIYRTDLPIFVSNCRLKVVQAGTAVSFFANSYSRTRFQPSAEYLQAAASESAGGKVVELVTATDTESLTVSLIVADNGDVVPVKYQYRSGTNNQICQDLKIESQE